MPDHQRKSYTVRYFTGDRWVSSNDLLADSDQDAIDLAQSARFGFDVEVWDGTRFVFGTDGHQNKKTPRPS